MPLNEPYNLARRWAVAAAVAAATRRRRALGAAGGVDTLAVPGVGVAVGPDEATTAGICVDAASAMMGPATVDNPVGTVCFHIIGHLETMHD